MPDINWGGDAESAPFTSRLDDESENLILAETDTGTGLFEWDGSAWQFRGPVEMNDEDVSGIGSLTATSGNFDSVSTEEADITDSFVLDSLSASDGETDRFAVWEADIGPWSPIGTSLTVQHTNVESDLETDILKIRDEFERGAFVFVTGHDGDSNQFVDLLTVTPGGGSPDVFQSQTRGDPPSRTYSDNFPINLEISANVGVSAFGIGGGAEL